MILENPEFQISYSKRNKYVIYSVIPTCSESFLKKDSRQAGVTKKEGFPASWNDNTKGYVNLFNSLTIVFLLITVVSGGVAEWLKALLSKSSILKGIVGSNPTSSASKQEVRIVLTFYFLLFTSYLF